MRLRRARYDVFDDEDAAARFRPAADRLQDLGAFAVVPVVEDHLEAADVGIAGYSFKHVGCHVTAALFETEPARPQLVLFASTSGRSSTVPDRCG